MYMNALESEVESLSAEMTRLRLMLHRVTQVMELPPLMQSQYVDPVAASLGQRATTSSQGAAADQTGYPIELIQQLLQTQHRQHRRHSSSTSRRHRKEKSSSKRSDQRREEKKRSRRRPSSDDESSSSAASKRSGSSLSSDRYNTNTSPEVSGPVHIAPGKKDKAVEPKSKQKPSHDEQVTVPHQHKADSEPQAFTPPKYAGKTQIENKVAKEAAAPKPKESAPVKKAVDNSPKSEGSYQPPQREDTKAYVAPAPAPAAPKIKVDTQRLQKALSKDAGGAASTSSSSSSSALPSAGQSKSLTCDTTEQVSKMATFSSQSPQDDAPLSPPPKQGGPSKGFNANMMSSSSSSRSVNNVRSSPDEDAVVPAVKSRPPPPDSQQQAERSLPSLHHGKKVPKPMSVMAYDTSTDDSENPIRRDDGVILGGKLQVPPPPQQQQQQPSSHAEHISPMITPNMTPMSTRNTRTQQGVRTPQRSNLMDRIRQAAEESTTSSSSSLDGGDGGGAVGKTSSSSPRPQGSSDSPRDFVSASYTAGDMYSFGIRTPQSSQQAPLGYSESQKSLQPPRSVANDYDLGLDSGPMPTPGSGSSLPWSVQHGDDGGGAFSYKGYEY